MFKICTKCGLQKLKTQFSKHPVSKDGLRPYCRHCAGVIEKQRRITNGEIIKERDRLRYFKNPAPYLIRARERYAKNPKASKDYNRERAKTRKKTDVLYKLKCNIRNLISMSLSKKGYSKKSRTYEILGCTYEELKVHLESKFLNEMNWENRKLWHIDHQIPLASAKNEEEILKLNHYTNLQPLWARDNLKKGCKF